MKTGSFLAVVGIGLLVSLTSSQAGWGHGCGGGGWGRGGGWNNGCGGGWGWGGGPRYGGWGWGGGPAFGVTVVAPQPVYYQAVYVNKPHYVYSHSLLASVQVQLARLGYYRGAIDGDFGPQTSRAIRNYQIDYNLPVTGQLDGRTLSRLDV